MCDDFSFLFILSPSLASSTWGKIHLACKLNSRYKMLAKLGLDKWGTAALFGEALLRQSF